jgi:hypothetical protein
VQDGGTLQMMQNKFNNQQEKTDHSVKADIVGFGWAALQIDILRECIVISEAIQGKYMNISVWFISLLWVRSFV